MGESLPLLLLVNVFSRFPKVKSLPSISPLPDITRESTWPMIQTRLLEPKEYVTFLNILLSANGRKITTGQRVFAMEATKASAQSKQYDLI